MWLAFSIIEGMGFLSVLDWYPTPRMPSSLEGGPTQYWYQREFQ
jgi:hypothetical protein